ncbi:hypothetical protein LG322_08740 [Microbacterium aerolatum]|uniref:hypothetical protein n=1 Tax=Microbacterium aerolatum TaxID=153731 RepID=UPI00384C0B36
MTTTQSIALFLYGLGAMLAIGGPAIAVIRRIAAYHRAKHYTGTFGEVDNMLDPEKVRATAMRDAGWGIAEFGLIGLGVVAATAASVILVTA